MKNSKTHYAWWILIALSIALPAYGFVYDAVGSYVPVLYAIIAMLVINIVCVFFAFDRQKKMVARGHWTK